jgi:hypothetical protein
MHFETVKSHKIKENAWQIPQSAPLVKSCMIIGSSLFSKYTHTRIIAPVSGITLIRPAIDGSFFAIAVTATAESGIYSVNTNTAEQLGQVRTIGIGSSIYRHLAENHLLEW